MELELIMPALLALAALFALPAWPHSREWGYYPAAILLAAMGVLSGLVLLGRLG
jgi:hypothetical protein